jgi:hypothetical protein
MRKPVAIALLLVAAAALFVLTPHGAALAEEARSVFVTNFPDVFRIKGTVTVDGPVKQAKYSALREVVVPPINPKDTVRLIQGGIIESDGFSGMVVGLQGQTKGEVYRAGTVGVYLLPDEDAIVKVYEEKGQTPFAFELTVSGVSGASPYFASSGNRLSVGFPRYRTYFYNTSDKTVSVNLYAYLTN